MRRFVLTSVALSCLTLSAEPSSAGLLDTTYFCCIGSEQVTGDLHMCCGAADDGNVYTVAGACMWRWQMTEMLVMDPLDPPNDCSYGPPQIDVTPEPDWVTIDWGQWRRFECAETYDGVETHAYEVWGIPGSWWFHPRDVYTQWHIATHRAVPCGDENDARDCDWSCVELGPI